MGTRNFDEWLGQFRPSISDYGYYVDFEKIHQNVSKNLVELNILNSLIGSKQIEQDLRNILNRYPEVLKCIPILLAVRSLEIYAQDEDGAFLYNFGKKNYTTEQYITFMRKTGLLNLLSEHLIKSLVDYVTGVETGIDSNGRKNRGGHLMENLVERFIQKSGAQYYKEMYLTEVERKWKVNLSAISADGNTQKRWDFVIKTPSTIYLMETNFYASSGSKLNETARSYKLIAEETKRLNGVEFIWITDGLGWNSAKKNLKETFEVLPHLYNISELEKGIFTQLFNR